MPGGTWILFIQQNLNGGVAARVMPIDSNELPAKRTWWIERGTDDRSILSWQAQGQPVLFDGCTATATILDDCGAIVLQVSTTPNSLGQIAFGSNAQGTAGNIYVSLAANATHILRRSRYRFVVQVVFPDGSKWDVAKGPVLVTSGVR